MLTSESRKALEETIRALRAELPERIAKHTQSRFRLSLALDKSKLSEPEYTARVRLEQWLDERVRAGRKGDEALLRQRALDAAVHECAATLVNRLVIVRAMEARGLSEERVLTGARRSPGYETFREFAPALCEVSEDESEGYATLLAMLFRELSTELPGLFGDVGVTGLLEVPAGALLDVVERLDAPALREAWNDDTTPGWVYQYWNDPAREALDAKVTDGGKIEPHEIASKTQMFTERYMVEWLLQNTLGLQWLALCQKHGWTPDALPVIQSLEARRAAWRGQRDRGEVAQDALMPVAAGIEQRWCYWVEQPVPASLVRAVGDSVREWKVLDPACGSGHFLVIAFGLLFELYREEARHRGESWSDRDIAQWIIEDNLHGVDLDPRAVQLAAASLWLTMRAAVRSAGAPRAPAPVLRRMNLVATSFELARLPAHDASLVRLERALSEEAGLDAQTTATIIARLKGLDTWGSLVRIHDELDKLLLQDDAGFVGGDRGQLALGQASSTAERARARKITEHDKSIRTRDAVQARLEAFLAQHTGQADLGVRLGGQQLAAGVRFAAMMREGTFDVVVGNPPYQGAGKMADSSLLTAQYKHAKADLYAAFMQRGLELAKPGSGLCAMVTMRNWMFLGQYEDFRKQIVRDRGIVTLGDLGWGAFADMTDNPVTMSVLCTAPTGARAVAICPADPTARVRTDEHRFTLIAGLRCGAGRYDFDLRSYAAIDGEPIVYWWSKELLASYAESPKLAKVAPVRQGTSTADNARFVRCPWELFMSDVLLSRDTVVDRRALKGWLPYIMGAGGRRWFDAASDVVNWSCGALGIRLLAGSAIRNESFAGRLGIAYTTVGAQFSARVHRFAGVFADKGASVFPDNLGEVVCVMNAQRAAMVMESLNPGVNFQVGDVNRLPLFPIESAETIYARLDEAFTQHERAREASVEFVEPGRSAWAYAQAWAQRAVDRAPGAPLEPYAPGEGDWLPPDSAEDPTASAEEHAAREAFDRVSYAIGVAMGRFGANGEGVLREAPSSALPGGVLFVSATGEGDTLAHPSAAPVRAAWESFGDRVAPGEDLRTWLRKGFFALHNARYEKRPIYLPLSSEKKSFVAWVSIHRWSKSTLTELVADHLEPLRRAMEAQLKELRASKESAAPRERTAIERKATALTALTAELSSFVESVRAIHDRGAPPAGDRCPPREQDHRFVMDLDDGVMINSAALWPLLDPQWKDPKKWWIELSKSDGRKDYDWSKMAARYWPTRVRAKCVADPSLAVAHGCFWELHPEKAWQWEHRLKGELGDDWVIDESGATERRAAWVKANGPRAAEIVEDERKRRERKAAASEASESGDVGDVGESGESGERELFG